MSGLDEFSGVPSKAMRCTRPGRRAVVLILAFRRSLVQEIPTGSIKPIGCLVAGKSRTKYNRETGADYRAQGVREDIEQRRRPAAEKDQLCKLDAPRGDKPGGEPEPPAPPVQQDGPQQAQRDEEDDVRQELHPRVRDPARRA